MTASNSETSAILLDWYGRNARDLPWRLPPGSPPPTDRNWPYRVWLSEVMLQQTTVAAVKPYFETFTTRWPSVEALAQAAEEEVMAAWAGLGYYSRARNLVKAARLAAARGGFPSDEAQLRQLPGFGAYTAAAVAAIAFGQRAVVVDANVERVVSRLFAIDEPLPGAKKTVRAATDEITPEVRAGDFAQAMMDLGARICTSRAPKCAACPLEQQCEAWQNGDPQAYPRKAAKKARPSRRGTAYWIESQGRVWLIRREPKGMLGAMRALPDDGWSSRSDGAGLMAGQFGQEGQAEQEGQAQPDIWQSAGLWQSVGAVDHIFTHFALTMEVKIAVLEEAKINQRDLPQGEWWPIADLEKAGLPTLFAKAAQRATSR